jgi:very-short-patch-repair endonuclease/DNA polymerase III delta prime subunit/plasmid maintenance system antidote protein VapI
MKDRVAVFREYQNKIIDLSRRNRLLKYPKTARAINFEMSFTEFQERFGNLEEIRINFPHRTILEAEGNDELLFNEESEAQQGEYLPPTKPSGEKLITLLNTLRLDTRRKFEEHGLHSLFLTFGKVRWKEPLAGRGSSGAVSEYDYNAPLLLAPVQITEIKRPKATIITTFLEEQDITANKVLSHLLESQYKASPPSLNESFLNDLGRVMSDLLSQVRETFAELNITYEVSEEIQVGQYSFHGQQIYEDLHRHEKAIINHAFVDALCSHTPIRQLNLKVATDDPDALLTLENDFNVLDADVSQLVVVQKALQNNHLTIQGPPGTGKSQTIVNLISNLLARQKSVLVICEKQVALEVVLSRLKKVGLDKLCLPLFYYDADKKEFAKTVIKDRDHLAKLATDQQDFDSALSYRQKKIRKLRAYAQALGEIVSPLGKTVQWVHGELARVQGINGNTLLPWKGPDPLSITFDDYHKLLSILEHLTPVFSIPSLEEFAHWRAIKRAHFSPDFVGRVSQALTKPRGSVEEYRRCKIQLVIPASIVQVRQCVSLGQLLSTVQPIDESLDQEIDILALSEVLDSALAALEDYTRSANAYPKKIAIPLRWNRTTPSLLGSCITRSTTITDLEDIKGKLQTIADNLKIVEEKTTGLPSKATLLQSSIQELLLVKDILLVDPVVKHLHTWQKASALQAALDQLKNIRAILSQLDKVKNVLVQWTIVPEELEAETVKVIAQRFEEKYGRFYRFIYPSYKKDCRAIKEWCSAGTPKSHAEYNEIALALKEWFKLTARLGLLLVGFSREHMAQNAGLEPRIVPRLFSSTKFLLEWLDAQRRQELPQAYAAIIEDNDGSGNLKDVLIASEQVNNALTFSKPAFELPELEKPYSVDSLSRLLPSLQAEVTAALALNQEVRALLTNSTFPATFAELLSDAEAIDGLASKLEKIQELKLESIFQSNSIVSEIINSPESFKDLVANIRTVATIISRLVQGKKITAKNAFKVIQALRTNMPVWQHFIEQYDKQAEELNHLFESDSSVQHFEHLSFDSFSEKLALMANDKRGLESWILYRRYASQLAQLNQAWFLEETKGLDGIKPPALFAQSLWSAWLEAHYKNSPVLYRFNKREHQKLIEEFRQLEEEVLKVNAARVFKSVAPTIRQAKRYGGRQDAELLHQSQLQRRHKAIRKLVQTCGTQLQNYKPCWMMSPLTLSSYIPYGSLEFDVVIFDEASQMRVEHSLGAIARAKQVIILGDQHQLPPTSFFEVTSDGSGDEEDTDVDYESILNAAKTVLPGADELLSYHYRSKFEDLIAFSNHHIYEDRLITFPNPDNQHRAVAFEHVPDGIYDSGGTRRNDIEARRVIELCARQAIEQPGKSIGVIAFSKAQEQAIREAKISFIKQNPQFETLLDEESELPDPFFIKNLETVQGDERDIIFLSVGYGRDRHGNVYNRFGPINTQYGYRRLNVAVTRAKEKVMCVSSIKAVDIHPSERARGAQLLQRYLEYAEQGLQVLQASRLVREQFGVEPDSPFELEVENALSRLGYIVHRQVGASGYKIDLAVVNPSNNEEYVLGIECDGASYHSSYSARVNDRIRQEILERLGWKIYRIWSQHWISSREDILEDIVKLVSDNSIPDASHPHNIDSKLLM